MAEPALLVGVIRAVEYPRLGPAVDQHVPDGVRHAYRYLIDDGFLVCKGELRPAVHSKSVGQGEFRIESVDYSC
jgi:hypothetical protein